MNDISIILVSWSPNAERLTLLRDTVETLRRCTKLPFEFVIVDNGPECQTEYIRSIHPDIHIINPVNQGPGVARNQGAQAAHGSILTFIDNDLWFCDGWLERSLAALAEFPRAIIAPGRSTPMKHRRNQLGKKGEYELFSLAAGWCWVMRRETFDLVGPFIGNDKHPVEDREWAQRANARGCVFVWPPHGVVRHRRRPKLWTAKHRLINGIWVKESNT